MKTGKRIAVNLSQVGALRELKLAHLTPPAERTAVQNALIAKSEPALTKSLERFQANLATFPELRLDPALTESLERFQANFPKFPELQLDPAITRLLDQFKASCQTFQDSSMERQMLMSGPVHSATLRHSPREDAILEVLQEIDTKMQSISECLPQRDQQAPDRAAETAPLRSGAQGRPTSMHLVLPELERRAAAGELMSSAAAESRSLALWLKAEYPKAASAGPSAIRNGIAEAHRTAKARIRSAPNADSAQRSDTV